MAQRYVQLAEDLQYAKREVATWKQKYNQAQIELQSRTGEVKELKKTIQMLQQSNNKLTNTNRLLSDEKNSISQEFSTEISLIKQQIAQKEKEIANLKDIATPVKIDQQIALRQLKYELQQEYNNQVISKDKKIQQLSALFQKANYDRQIQRQKSKLRIETLQQNLKQLQNRYDRDIADYSVRLFQQSQIKPSQDKEYLRRIKRQNDQLRKKYELGQNELSKVLQQKTQITKQYTKWTNQYQKQVGDIQTQCQLYKAQVNRLNDIIQQNSHRKDDMNLKDRQREIKRLKHELQQLRDDIIFKDKKISQFDLQRVKLLNQIKMGKTQKERASDLIEQQLRNQRERLLRELNQTRYSLQKLKTQNIDLQDKIYDMSKLSVDNKRRWQEIKKEQAQQKQQQLHNHLLIRQKSQQIIPTLQKSIDHGKKESHVNQQALNAEKGKVKEILTKYIEVKQANSKLQKKLQKANLKIVELLQQKIILGSPKANNSRKIEFPTDGSTGKVYHQYNQTHSIDKRSHSKEKSPSPFKSNTYHNIEGRNRPHQHLHSQTNPGLRRDFFSPQQDRFIRIEGQIENEKNYYEKSLKMRSGQKFRQLKCINHEKDNHEECEY